MKTAAEPEKAGDEAEQPGKDPGKTTSKAAEKTSASEPRATPPSQLDDLLATVRRLEAFAFEEAKRVSDKVLPQAESKARENIWVSLLFALGLGLILGLWLNGRRRD